MEMNFRAQSAYKRAVLVFGSLSSIIIIAGSIVLPSWLEYRREQSIEQQIKESSGFEGRVSMHTYQGPSWIPRDCQLLVPFWSRVYGIVLCERPSASIPPRATGKSEDDAIKPNLLQSFRHLEYIDLRIRTDAGLYCFRQLCGPNCAIKGLSLSLSDQDAITDAGIAELRGMNIFLAINLRGTRVTNAGLVNFRDMADLIMLDLSNTMITDAGLESLQGCTKILFLDLSNTKITGVGLESLNSLHHLIDLDLSETEVDDHGLNYLETQPGLETLRLRGTKITDRALEYLEKFGRLKTLDIHDTHVTREGVERLRDALPGCEVRWRHPAAK